MCVCVCGGVEYPVQGDDDGISSRRRIDDEKHTAGQVLAYSLLSLLGVIGGASLPEYRLLDDVLLSRLRRHRDDVQSHRCAFAPVTASSRSKTLTVFVVVVVHLFAAQLVAFFFSATASSSSPPRHPSHREPTIISSLLFWCRWRRWSASGFGVYARAC
ncbi:hypothetical protein QR680_015017 [Steinernema hermaphroditum]|uniref:Uncharacterized protein n=1 Tax=Steinernema hermaphroditum TaxID=289476 RepID=A0AA39ID36_9BILA|nr:hypothetical protein QR680_015017 [Steinernema hermaphroditum]